MASTSTVDKEAMESIMFFMKNFNSLSASETSNLYEPDISSQILKNLYLTNNPDSLTSNSDSFTYEDSNVINKLETILSTNKYKNNQSFDLNNSNDNNIVLNNKYPIFDSLHWLNSQNATNIKDTQSILPPYMSYFQNHSSTSSQIATGQAFNTNFPSSHQINNSSYLNNNESNLKSFSNNISLTPTASTYSLYSDINETANLTCDVSPSSFVPSETTQKSFPNISLNQIEANNFLWKCYTCYHNFQENFNKHHFINSQQKALEAIRIIFNYFTSTLTQKDSSNLKNKNLPKEFSFEDVLYLPPDRTGNFHINGTSYSTPPILAHPDEFINPSSFLKIYGDPLCGSDKLPVKGIYGNWECLHCGNVNYPRRFKCNICNCNRGKEGDTIVSHYVRYVYDYYRAFTSKGNEHSSGTHNNHEDFNTEIINSNNSQVHNSRISNCKKKSNSNFNRKKPH